LPSSPVTVTDAFVGEGAVVAPFVVAAEGSGAVTDAAALGSVDTAGTVPAGVDV